MFSPCTISRWIADLGEYLYFKNPKGYYRTLWAKCHPAAVLEDRQAQMQSKVDAFKRSFGSGRKRARAKLTAQQFEQRRQKALKALLADNSLKS